MIEFIQNETKKIMYKCCEKHATSVKKNVEDVQLILALNTSHTAIEPNKYLICEEYVPKKELTILEVLGVKIDFKNYSQIAPPFIFKSLVRFSEKHSVPYDKISVMCVPTTNENNKPDILLALYNSNNFIEEISFNDLFNPEDLNLENAL